MKNTENIRRHIGESVTIRWGTSRGRDSYGYTTCSLRNQRGERVAACNGGGYDMRGTVLGDWLARTFPNELRAIKAADMPARSHWEPARARVCCGKCEEEARDAFHKALAADENAVRAELPKLPDDCFECPVCKGPTRQSREGKTVQDGRSFYGLTFHDPNYDASKAVIGRDCSDRTLTHPDGSSEGKTVGEAEAAGVSVGLERLQATYKASSKHATERHTVPSIDGGCGESCVLDVARAIGITLRKVADTSKLDVYIIEAATPRK